MSFRKFAGSAGLVIMLFLVMALFASNTSAEFGQIVSEGPSLVSWNGVEVGNDVSTTPFRSATMIAFSSQATNLDLDVSIQNLGRDIYVSEAGVVTLVTRVGDHDADGSSTNPVISEDESCLVFQSSTSELVAGVNGYDDNIFVFRFGTGEFELLTQGYDGSPANGDSGIPVVSSDCRYVAFTSKATNLVEGDNNGEQDVFRVDTSLPAYDPGRISRVMAEEEPNGLSAVVDISSDGSKLAIVSYASNLTVDDGPYPDLFVVSFDPMSIDWVSDNVSGEPGDGSVLFAGLSPNGRFVVFSSLADNMVPEEGSYTDVFLRDLNTDQLYLVSHDKNGGPSNNESGLFGLDVSDLGNVVYSSKAYDLVEGTSGFSYRMYLWQYASNQNFLVKDLAVCYPVMYGNQISFYTYEGVVPEDTNGMADVYNLGFDIDLSPPVTPTVTSSPSPTPDLTSTPTATPTVTSSPSPTPDLTSTPTATPTVTPSPSPTPDLTSTPTVTPTVTPRPTPAVILYFPLVAQTSEK